jgi:hypothetical protein
MPAPGDETGQDRPRADPTVRGTREAQRQDVAGAGGDEGDAAGTGRPGRRSLARCSADEDNELIEEARALLGLTRTDLMVRAHAC